MKVGHHSLEDQFQWARWVKFKFCNFLSKIRNSICSISRSYCLIDQSGEGNYPRVSTYFNWYSIPVRSIEKVFDRKVLSIDRDS